MRGHGRFVARLEPLQNMAARLGVNPFSGVKVLYADRQSLERSPLFRGEARVTGLRHLQRLVRRDLDKRVEPPGALDRFEMSLGDLDAGNRPRLETMARLGERQGGQIGQNGSL